MNPIIHVIIYQDSCSANGRSVSSRNTHTLPICIPHCVIWANSRLSLDVDVPTGQAQRGFSWAFIMFSGSV